MFRKAILVLSLLPLSCHFWPGNVDRIANAAGVAVRGSSTASGFADCCDRRTKSSNSHLPVTCTTGCCCACFAALGGCKERSRPVAESEEIRGIQDQKV